VQAVISVLMFFHGLTAPSGPRPPLRVSTITHRHITLGGTPLDEWSSRRRDLYLTTHNSHSRQTSMPPGVFESTIPASERLQSHTLRRAATVIRLVTYSDLKPNIKIIFKENNSSTLNLWVHQLLYS